MATAKAWEPPISAKQRKILSDYGLLHLVVGPRHSTKTVGCCHAVAFHLWNTPRARACMLGRSITDVFNCGTWALLTETVIPQWIGGGFGMEWATKRGGGSGKIVEGHVMEGASHRYYFDVTNRFGGTSRMYLESLNNEDEVETKFKNKMYSMAYLIELTNFHNPRIIDVMEETFRGMHWGREHFRLIADTNPDYEQGEDSWIYQLWYWFRTLDLDNLNEDEEEKLLLNQFSPEEKANRIAALKERQRLLSSQEFVLDDNIWMTEAEKNEVKSRYLSQGNISLYEAYVNGKWVKAATNGVFKEVWKPEIHMLGDPPLPSGKLPESILLPEEECIELVTGNDIGARSTAHAFIEKFPLLLESGIVVPAFKVIDEYVSIWQDNFIEDIADAIIEKVQFWEMQCGRKLLWRHWSDTSSTVRRDTVGRNTEQLEIRRFTRGRIIMQSIGDSLKSPGMVERQAEFLRRLLFEGRLFVSRSRCPETARMFSNLRRNRNGKVDKGSIHKHIFDAIRYAITMESWHEIGRGSYQGPNVGSARTPIKIISDRM